MQFQGKKKIKRRQDGGKTINYFSDDTQESIKNFLEEQDTEKRRKIYQNEIFPAFDSLIQNLIFVYKFKSSGVVETLKSDCLSFLFEVLHKFDPSKGSKAFSYFNVVAKNWLIINTRKDIDNVKKSVSIEDTDSLTPENKREISEYKVICSPDDQIIARERKDEILKILLHIKNKKLGENEVKCLNAIETLFTTIDTIDFLNKRAILFYLKDISGLNKKDLSKSLVKLKKHYKKSNLYFLNED